MGFPIRKCKCGATHECPLMDPVDNGRRAALARRPRITNGRIDVAGAAAASEPEAERSPGLASVAIPDAEPRMVHQRRVGASDIESAQEKQAKAFIERMTKKARRE